jgi:hypothetical protein
MHVYICVCVCSAIGSNFQLHAICVKCTTDERPSIFLRDKPIFSSERMIHNGYYRKSSVEKKISGRGSQGA